MLDCVKNSFLDFSLVFDWDLFNSGDILVFDVLVFIVLRFPFEIGSLGNSQEGGGKEFHDKIVLESKKKF